MIEIPETWTFKTDEIVKNFDSHVNEQLPWYDFASFCVAYLVCCYLPSGGIIYDIGSSTGNIIKRISKISTERAATIISIDDSIDMILSQKNTAEKICANASILNYKSHDVTVIFLTLSFLKISERKPLLLKIIEKLNDGGALIVVDKFTQENLTHYLETSLKRMTVSFKQKNKIPPDEIIKKELSISGVSRPVSRQLFEKLEFKNFFKIGEFEGWLFEK